MITHKQLTLAEFFKNCQNIFINNKPEFLSVLENAISLDEIVPSSFITHFSCIYKKTLQISTLCAT